MNALVKDLNEFSRKPIVVVFVALVVAIVTIALVKAGVR